VAKAPGERRGGDPRGPALAGRLVAKAPGERRGGRPSGFGPGRPARGEEEGARSTAGAASALAARSCTGRIAGPASSSAGPRSRTITATPPRAAPALAATRSSPKSLVQVIGPTMPSTKIPVRAWKSRTAASVTGPYMPSTGTARRSWMASTAAPVLPAWNIRAPPGCAPIARSAGEVAPGPPVSRAMPVAARTCPAGPATMRVVSAVDALRRRLSRFLTCVLIALRRRERSNERSQGLGDARSRMGLVTVVLLFLRAGGVS